MPGKSRDNMPGKSRDNMPGNSRDNNSKLFSTKSDIETDLGYKPCLLIRTYNPKCFKTLTIIICVLGPFKFLIK